MSFPLDGLGSAWVVGGGYKYLQLGEGNCFLRVPPHGDELRPRFTGWYAEFAELAAEKTPGAVEYPRGGMRFAGATYDPTSHYRAARVFDFFQEQGLTPEALRENYLRQTTLLADALGIEARREDYGGFVAVEVDGRRGGQPPPRRRGSADRLARPPPPPRPGAVRDGRSARAGCRRRQAVHVNGPAAEGVHQRSAGDRHGPALGVDVGTRCRPEARRSSRPLTLRRRPAPRSPRARRSGPGARSPAPSGPRSEARASSPGSSAPARAGSPPRSRARAARARAPSTSSSSRRRHRAAPSTSGSARRRRRARGRRSGSRRRS